MNRKNEWGNRRISERQLGRMLFHDYFPMVGLVLPMYLAGIGSGGLLSLVLGLLCGYLLLLLYSGIVRGMGQDYLFHQKTCVGKWLTGSIRFVYSLAALLASAYGLELVGELAADYLSADVPVWLFLVTAALVAAYGLFTGIESRGRKYGILFWLLVLPLAVVFLLAFGSVKPGRLLGQAGLDGSSLRGAWQVFCFLQGTAFLPVYAPVAENPEALVRAAKRGFCLAAAGNVALYLLLSGVFGVPTLAVMEHGALTLTALVKIPGGFLERQDALLCGIWILSVYAFAENSMGIMCYCLGGLENERQGHVAAVLSVLAALALGLCMHGFPKCQDAMWWLWRSLVVPVLTAVGIVGAILTKWRCKKRKEQSWDEAEE